MAYDVDERRSWLSVRTHAVLLSIGTVVVAASSDEEPPQAASTGAQATVSRTAERVDIGRTRADTDVEGI